MSFIKTWTRRSEGAAQPIALEAWVISFSAGRARGLLARREGTGQKIRLLAQFEIPCPLDDSKAGARALRRAGVRKGSGVILLADSEDCVLALIDDLGAPEAEASQALRWKMAERVEFDMSEAILEAQKIPGADEGGLQKPSWWAAAMSESRLREQLRVVDALGCVCLRVEAEPFAQNGLASAGWEQQKARALVCVGEASAALSFTANGSLLFHKQLDWRASELNEASAETWDRLELDLVRSLDYFERRLSSVATGELRLAGPLAGAWAPHMSERLPLPSAAFEWSEIFIDECGALEPASVGGNLWLLGAATALPEAP